MIDGAEEILGYLKKQGLKIGIVSNTIFPERFHLSELKRFRLYPYLDFHVFSSTVSVRKPHPRIFQQALDNLMVDASQAVFVGDRLVEDVGGAQQAGMKGILKYHEGRDYTAPIIPDVQINELNELKRVVSGADSQDSDWSSLAPMGDTAAVAKAWVAPELRLLPVSNCF